MYIYAIFDFLYKSKISLYNIELKNEKEKIWKKKFLEEATSTPKSVAKKGYTPLM